MGQSLSSSKKLSQQEVSKLFGIKCSKQLSGIELWSLKDTFIKLAETEGDIQYWKQDTFVKFLGIPDSATGMSDLLFKSASFLASFPFVWSLSPAPLTLENLVKVIVLSQGKHQTILKRDYDVVKLIFLSFSTVENEPLAEKSNINPQSPGEAAADEDDLIVFDPADGEAWNDLTAIRNFENLTPLNWFISGIDFLNLVTFLLAIASLRNQTQLVELLHNFEPNHYDKFKQGALNLIRAIDIEIKKEEDVKTKRVGYAEFKTMFDQLFPHLFEPLGELYGLLLFSKSLNNNKLKLDDKSLMEHKISGLFENENETKLVNPASLAQLSIIFGPDQIYGRLKKLYVGSSAGFSMRSFEAKVFKWNAPSFLLVSGHLLNPNRAHVTGRERAFEEHIPGIKRLKNDTSKGTTVTFGLYLSEPWKASSKHSFGNAESVLFQLEPVLDKFTSNKILYTNYAYFSRMQPGGIGAGSPPPQLRPGNNTLRSGFSLGNVSLTLDESLEYGVFRHLGLGGSYKGSLSRGHIEWEDRFEITEVEVWGCGREEDLEEQKKRWEWEEREAALRAKVNIDTMKEDRALLEMAGLVGNHGNGGSV
jgi:hypothetical protein